MSLFDLFASDDPKDQAYLAMAAGLLGNRGNFGSVLGQSLMGAQDTYQNARKSQREASRVDQQHLIDKLRLDEIQRNAEERLKRQANEEAWRNSLASPQMQAAQSSLAAGGGPTVANATNIKPADPYSQLMYDMAKRGVLSPAEFLSGSGKLLDREDQQAARSDAQKATATAAMERLLSQQNAARERQQEQIAADERMRRILAANRPPAAEQPLEAVIGPDGNPVLVPRRNAIGKTPYQKPTGTAEKNLTEDQGKAISWLERMDQSEKVIKNAPESALQSTGSIGGMIGATIGSVPYLGNTGAAKLSRNVVETPERQAVRNAQEVWVQGLLRSDTGAAYKDMEKDDIIRAFFWQPGESEALRTQKDMAREGVKRAMLVRAGPAVDRLSKVPKAGATGEWTIEVEK
jgi:hypothetical protein